MIFAQLGGMCSQLKEVCDTMASISDDDPDVLDEDTDLTVLQEKFMPLILRVSRFFKKL